MDVLFRVTGDTGPRFTFNKLIAKQLEQTVKMACLWRAQSSLDLHNADLVVAYGWLKSFIEMQKN